MVKTKAIEEIIQAVCRLPADKIEEVRTLVLQMKQQYLSESDEDWTEQELRELTACSMKYLDQTDSHEANAYD